MTTWFQKFFSYVGLLSAETKKFIFNHPLLFEFVFFMLYTIEQAVLIWYVETRGATTGIIGYFSLIVLATFGLHKLVIESRLRVLEDQVNVLKREKNTLKSTVDDMVSEQLEFNKLKKFRKL